MTELYAGPIASGGVGQLYIVITNTFVLCSVENAYQAFGNSMEEIFIEVTLFIGSGNIYAKSVDFVV
jgi:hypothetical protein